MQVGGWVSPLTWYNVKNQIHQVYSNLISPQLINLKWKQVAWCIKRKKKEGNFSINLPWITKMWIDT
jgi:hypothetical protein